MIADWLMAVQEGKGHLSREAVIPADYAKAFEHITQEAYLLQLPSASLNWPGLCDAHPDLLFGGMELLTSFETGQIDLFFAASDDRLLCARISADTPEGELFATIRITAPGAQITEEPEGTEVVEGLLSEEWSLMYQSQG